MSAWIAHTQDERLVHSRVLSTTAVTTIWPLHGHDQSTFGLGQAMVTNGFGLQL